MQGEGIGDQVNLPRPRLERDDEVLNSVPPAVLRTVREAVDKLPRPEFTPEEIANEIEQLRVNAQADPDSFPNTYTLKMLEDPKTAEESARITLTMIWTHEERDKRLSEQGFWPPEANIWYADDGEKVWAPDEE